MLVFRLFRVGKNNQPSYKIVVTDKRNPSKGGRFVEQIGFYNPVTKEKTLNKERAQYWLKQGVQPSATVHNLFIKDGILEGKKISKHKKSKKAPVAAPVAAAAAPAEAASPKPAEKPAEAPKLEESPKPAEKVAEVKPVEAAPQVTEAKPLSSEPQASETPKTE
ncbi:MAG: 30S ribosomal protein S16 [Candidatus Nealsonbacteria bacterium]